MCAIGPPELILIPPLIVVLFLQFLTDRLCGGAVQVEAEAAKEGEHLVFFFFCS